MDNRRERHIWRYSQKRRHCCTEILCERISNTSFSVTLAFRQCVPFQISYINNNYEIILEMQDVLTWGIMLNMNSYMSRIDQHWRSYIWTHAYLTLVKVVINYVLWIIRHKHSREMAFFIFWKFIGKHEEKHLNLLKEKTAMCYNNLVVVRQYRV